MPRSSGRETKPHLMRNRIAAQAARLLAESGTDDIAAAKRKAARQLGAESTQSLPGDDEVEAELEAYLQLYRAEDHAVLIRDMRRKALSAMHFFEKFDPYLTGSVLKGLAGRNSVVNVQLFTASEKELEFFLLDRQIPFELADERHFGRAGNEHVCVFHIDWQGIPLRLALYEPRERRGALNAAPGNAPAGHAGIAALERLLEAGAPAAGS